MNARRQPLNGWIAVLLAVPAMAWAQAPSTSATLCDFSKGTAGWRGLNWDPTAGHSAPGCGAWSAAVDPVAAFAVEDRVWTGFSDLGLWVRALEPIRPLLLSVWLVADDPATPDQDRFESSSVVCDEGWANVALPAWDFVPQGEPSWARIERVELRVAWADGAAVNPVPELRIDDVTYACDAGLAPEPDTLVLGDMESDTCRWAGLSVSADEARGGKRSGLWADPVGTPWLSTRRVPRDWARYSTLRFSAAPVGKPRDLRVRVYTSDPAVDFSSYFATAHLAADEWTDVALPLWQFEASNAPSGWGSVHTVTLIAGPPEIPAAPGAVLLDDIRLTKEPIDPVILLGDDVTGWAHVTRSEEDPADGAACADWGDPGQVPWIDTRRLPDDWSPYYKLSLSLWSALPNGQEIRVQAYTGVPEVAPDPFWTSFQVDWQGWKRVELPLWGFQPSRSPRGWSHVTALALAAGGGDVRPLPDTRLKVDDVRLERGAVPDEVVLLGDDTRGWAHVTTSTQDPAEGTVCADWADPAKEPWIDTRRVPRDWSSFGRLSFWLWSARANSQPVRVQAYSGDPEAAQDLFWTTFRVNWEGWQRVELPFWLFGRQLSPRGWDYITALSLSLGGDAKPLDGTHFRVDGVKLERAQMPNPVVLLDEAADIGRWEGLFPSDAQVAAGAVSAMWPDTRYIKGIGTPGIPADLAELEALELSVYNEPRRRSYFVIELQSDRPETKQFDVFKTVVDVDWDGWKTLRLCPWDFAPVGRPLGWSKIGGLHMYVGGRWEKDLLPHTTLYLDRVQIRLRDPGSQRAGPALQANWRGYRDWAWTTPRGLADEPPDALYVTGIAPLASGEVWVAAEEGGLIRVGASGGCTQYTTGSGLLDPFVYSVAHDSHGMLYVGQGRHGLLRFDPAAGQGAPVGEPYVGRHVYDVEMAAGDQKWVASETGVTVLSAGDQVLAHFDDTAGLPGPVVLDVALGQDGTAWAVPSTGGLAYYQDGRGWQLVEWPRGAPWLSHVAVDSSGRAWAGGPGGLVCVPSPGAEPVDGTAPPGAPDPQGAALPLGGRYITGLLARGDALFVATRQQGLFRLGAGDAPGSWAAEPVLTATDAREPYIRGLAVAGGRLLVGTFGDGLYELAAELPIPEPDRPRVAVATAELPPARGGAKTDLAGRLPDNRSQPWALYVGEDWTTLGDWVGAYGNAYTCLCGMYGRDDVYLAQAGADGRGWTGMSKRNIAPYIGTQKVPGDSMRRWVQWESAADRRVLLDPWSADLTGRRQGEWDDHGEAYGFGHDGPDLYVDLAPPDESPVLVSLYFFNKDGHTDENRCRDFAIEVVSSPLALAGGEVPCPPGGRQSLEWASDHPRRGSARPPGVAVLKYAADVEGEFARMPVLAGARVRDHRGGCYQRFLLNGGHSYTFHIDDAGSWNVNLSGVFVDGLENGLAFTRDVIVRDRAADGPRSVFIGW